MLFRSIGYAQDRWGDLEFETLNVTGSTERSTIGEFGNRYLKSMPANVAVDHSFSKESWQTRFFWVSPGEQSIEQLSQKSLSSGGQLSSLLKHPSLADAGGVDVLDSQIFWTERATGRLWTADSEVGGEVRSGPPPLPAARCACCTPGASRSPTPATWPAT